MMSAGGERRGRRSLRPLQRDLAAESLVRASAAWPRARRAGRCAAPLRPRASPSSRRIAIQRAFGTPGAAASISGTSSATARSNSGVPFDAQRLGRRSRRTRRRPLSLSSACTPSPVRATIGTAGTPRSRDRLRASTSMPLRLRFVHQVDGDDHAVGDLEHLQHEIQVALERARVDDDDRAVGPAEQQEVARDLLVAARPRAASRCPAGRRACSGRCRTGSRLRRA